MPVRKQEDGFNCDTFVIVYTTEILDRKSPIDAQFDVPAMKNHYYYIIIVVVLIIIIIILLLLLLSLIIIIIIIITFILYKEIGFSKPHSQY